MQLRVHALTAIASALRGAGKGCPDTLARDLMKMLKTLLTDQVIPLRVAALEVSCMCRM
jgi:hypothetical protein